MRSMRLVFAAILVVGLGASPGWAYHDHSNSLLGALVGAGLGGLAGSGIGKGTGNKVAIGAGTFLGAVIGSRLFSAEPYYYPSYIPSYRAPAVSYIAEPTRYYYRPEPVYVPVPVHAPAPAQPYCREFYTTVFVGGVPQQLYGTACRQPDGSWLVGR